MASSALRLRAGQNRVLPCEAFENSFHETSKIRSEFAKLGLVSSQLEQCIKQLDLAVTGWHDLRYLNPDPAALYVFDRALNGFDHRPSLAVEIQKCLAIGSSKQRIITTRRIDGSLNLIRYLI